MKIIIDSAIPYIKGVLEPYFDVIYKAGKEINAEDIRDCDGMIIRTRTKCNKELLDNSNIKFIGSATIGFDHIDMDYCQSKGIKVATAAGCNALAVVQYVLRAIEELAKRHNRDIKSVGIVGVGNVGKALNNELIKRGYTTLLNDPPRAANENDFNNTDLSQLLLNSDLITLHIPLNNTTRGYANSNFFSEMGTNKLFINASRGEVVEESALIDAIDKKSVISPVIDVWCNEPNISTELLSRTFIATPHIAGYSRQGKGNGTAMMVSAIAKYFDIEELLGWYPAEISRNIDANIDTSLYNILEDNNLLREDISKFEELRNNYQYRDEAIID